MRDTRKQNILKLLENIRHHLDKAAQTTDQQAEEIEAHLQKSLNILLPKNVSEAESKLIEVWSDGACSGNPGPGGWGTIIRFNGDDTELSGFSPKTTNNIMELTGALQGIRKTPAGSRLILTSDSQYLVKGMTEWIKGWKRRNWKKADGQPVLNREIWVELDKEASQRRIEWKWIKGHAGHPENERCDELARKAIEYRGTP